MLLNKQNITTQNKNTEMENWKDLKRVLINRMEKLMLLDKQNRTKKYWNGKLERSEASP